MLQWNKKTRYSYQQLSRSLAMRKNDDKLGDGKENMEQVKEQYKCKECGIDFGNSLGDMEVHKLNVLCKN